MDFASLRALVAQGLDDTVFFSDADIANAINEGYMELADDCEFHEVVERVELQGRNNNLLTMLTYPCVSFRMASNPRTNKFLVYCSVRDLDELFRSWQTVEGEPEYFTVRSFKLLQTYPHVNVPVRPPAGRIGLEEWNLSTPNVYSATDRTRINLLEFAVASRFADGAFDVWYTGIPPRLESDSDEPQLPIQFHLALVEYALYSLYCDDGETVKALEHWASYRAIRDRLYVYMQSRQTHDRIGVIGASLRGGY